MADGSASNIYTVPLDQTELKSKPETPIAKIAVVILSTIVLACVGIIIWLAVTR